MKQQNSRFGKVAVLMGGQSAEREVSLMSGNGVLQALRARGIDAHPFDPAERPMDDLRREGFARCFIALHGRHGEDGTVQGALELLGIPYTGAGVMASSIGIDKVMTKRVWREEGLPTPRYVALQRGRYSAEYVRSLGTVLGGLPLIVKPARGGSSLGVSKVDLAVQLESAVAQAAELDDIILCEQFIDGDEFTALVLGDGDEARALPVIRIIAPEGNYDYQNKYFSDATQYRVPCGLPADDEAAIKAIARKAYRVLGCRGWGRIDLMIERDAGTPAEMEMYEMHRTVVVGHGDSRRRPYLLEINTSPGMTSHSLAPMAARAAGMSYEELCVHLLENATLDDPQPTPPGKAGRQA